MLPVKADLVICSAVIGVCVALISVPVASYQVLANPVTIYYIPTKLLIDNIMHLASIHVHTYLYN